MAKDIIVLDSDTTTGKLVLDGEYIEAKVLAMIKWTIRDPKVASIRIEAKEGSENIFFLLHPPSEHARSGRGLVDPFAGGKTFEYCIYWKASLTGIEYKHDPIIAIKPGLKLIWLLSFILSLFGLSYFISKSIKRKRK